MSDWMYSGFDHGLKLQKEQEEVRKSWERQRQAPKRFWLNKGAETEVILCDDDPKGIYEYNLKLDGKWGNFFTCVRDKTGVDPFLKIQDKIPLSRSFVGFLTIIDCTKYVDSKNVERSFTKKLLPMTQKSLAKFAAMKKKRGSLVGWKFSVSRTNDPKSERIGDMWDALEKVDLSSLKHADGTPVNTTPINYEECLAPRPESEINTIINKIMFNDLNGVPVAQATETTQENTQTVESDVPF